MNKFDFDKPIDRSGTQALKFIALDQDPAKKDIIPLWVADMDFPSPTEISEAVQKRAAHPIYGYTRPAVDYFDVLSTWHAGRYGLDLKAEDFLSGPGTVASMGITIRALTKIGDGVLIFTPVYGPFFTMIKLNGRTVIEVPMTLDAGGRYSFSEKNVEDALDAAAAKGISVPLIMFCSPHNPGGMVWRCEELAMLLEIARRHDMKILSDEIHRDFVFPPLKFTSIMAFPEHKERILAMSAANKTFNLGGLHVSHFIVKDKTLSSVIRQEINACDGGGTEIFAQVATETAYRSCAYWIDALLPYLKTSIDEAVSFINTEIPGLKAYTPEGTYLFWVDAKSLIKKAGLSGDIELGKKLESQARVKCSEGANFGDHGAGFIRINAACPRSYLMEGLHRIRNFALSL
ncbi:cystathionine beta-lyase [Spirochaetia bacterium]|nr:cystathionine beta-lyase [Spirochaetia bacterium]